MWGTISLSKSLRFGEFEVNLNTLIARLREALGDSAVHPRFIETLPKRGYRFRAAVSEWLDWAAMNAINT